jgi:hypothetical protein
MIAWGQWMVALAGVILGLVLLTTVILPFLVSYRVTEGRLRLLIGHAVQVYSIDLRSVSNIRVMSFGELLWPSGLIFRALFLTSRAVWRCVVLERPGRVTIVLTPRNAEKYAAELRAAAERVE